MTSPSRAIGRRPARVIAVHKDTSIVRGTDGIDRSAVVTGRFRYDALAASDFPAVGDWVALEPTSPEAGPTISWSSRPSCRGARRSCAAPPMRAGARPATSPTSRSSRPTWTSRSSWPGSTTTSTCAGSSATWPSPGRAASTRSSSSTRPTSPTTSRVAWSPWRPIAPGVPSSSLSALTGDHLADLGEYLRARSDRGRARVLGRRQVDARQRPARRAAPGDGRGPRRRLARPPHDDPPRAVPAARRRAAHRHPGHPLARDRRRRRGRRDGVRRHHRAGPGLPLPGLPPPGRAGLRRPRGAR